VEELPSEVLPGHSITIRLDQAAIVEDLSRIHPIIATCWFFFSVKDAVGKLYDSPFLRFDPNDKDYPVWDAQDFLIRR
jgi:hypothetical protein